MHFLCKKSAPLDLDFKCPECGVTPGLREWRSSRPNAGNRLTGWRVHVDGRGRWRNVFVRCEENLRRVRLRDPVVAVEAGPSRLVLGGA